MYIQFLQSSPVTWADSAVHSQTKGSDRGFRISHFPGIKKANPSIEVPALSAIGPQHNKALECKFCLSRNEAMQSTSFQILDMPSTLLKYNFQSSRHSHLASGLWLWCSCVTGVKSWERKHGRKPGCSKDGDVMHSNRPKEILISFQCTEGAHLLCVLDRTGKPLLQQMVLAPGWWSKGSWATSHSTSVGAAAKNHGHLWAGKATDKAHAAKSSGASIGQAELH